MNFIEQSSNILNFLVLLGILLGGGMTAYLILKNRVASFWKVEAEAYKESVNRLEKEMEWMKKEILEFKEQNHKLTTERNYLKAIIIEALTTQKTVAKDLLKHIEEEAKGDEIKI